ncbi:SOS response-associated peptidase family protein [Novosphingobium sp.]|uniref:SOS response-associated peptidase family protein n=1 Tax=Novosphingobium sp. TaxID=1874826 RepID=UPI00286BFCD3|nr:SOS response-associated peptidase family protein [Novosphingobium sp.]
MTVVYRLDYPAAQIAAQFGAAAGTDPWAGGLVSPGQFAPVITAGREAIAGPRQPHQPRRMVPRLWGVPPPPGAGERGGAVLSVRNLESPFWIGNLRNSEFRCLIPATAFMVWSKGVDAAGKRVPRWISCTDQPLFAFAGVWKDSEVPSFALLTCEPNAVLHGLGAERMPAILPPDPEAWRQWLNGGWDRAQELVQPYSSSAMRPGIRDV